MIYFFTFSFRFSSVIIIGLFEIFRLDAEDVANEIIVQLAALFSEYLREQCIVQLVLRFGVDMRFIFLLLRNLSVQLLVQAFLLVHFSSF